MTERRLEIVIKTAVDHDCNLRIPFYEIKKYPEFKLLTHGDDIGILLQFSLLFLSVDVIQD